MGSHDREKSEMAREWGGGEKGEGKGMKSWGGVEGGWRGIWA